MSDPTAPGSDQPDPTAPPGETPAYGSGFGVRPPANIEQSSSGPSWVPQKSDLPPQSPTSGAAPGQGPVPQVSSNPYRGPVSPSASQPEGPQNPNPGAGFQVKGWHIGAVLGIIFIPLIAWIGYTASNGDDDEPGPITRPTTTNSRTLVTRPSLPTITRQTSTYSPTTRTRTTNPPKTSMVPPATAQATDIPVTPVPKQGKVIRFEAFAEKGTKIEVAFSSATAARLEYPAQEGPLAFEIPISSPVDKREYYSFRVRTDYAAGVREGDVACRVLVDGVVVISEQGQGYATCYISPYYDAQRK